MLVVVIVFNSRIPSQLRLEDKKCGLRACRNYWSSLTRCGKRGSHSLRGEQVKAETAGNLLILFVLQLVQRRDRQRLMVGRKQLRLSISANNYAVIFYKIAAGGDAAPTVAAITSAVISAQLAEFSGNATTTPVDQTGLGGGATSPETATLGAADTAAGELILMCCLMPELQLVT